MLICSILMFFRKSSGHTDCIELAKILIMKPHIPVVTIIIVWYNEHAFLVRFGKLAFLDQKILTG